MADLNEVRSAINSSIAAMPGQLAANEAAARPPPPPTAEARAAAEAREARNNVLVELQAGSSMGAAAERTRVPRTVESFRAEDAHLASIAKGNADVAAGKLRVAALQKEIDAAARATAETERQIRAAESAEAKARGAELRERVDAALRVQGLPSDHKKRGKITARVNEQMIKESK
jgi:hypothetical protein